MFGTVLGILSALVSAGVGIYSAYQSKKQQDLAEKTSQENFNLQQEQFEYQKELNQTVQEREDTSMQRQIADLKAAGISPLAVTNGASATPLTSANAPQKDISGIQTALNNQFSAFNDIFNRRLARQQFAIQSKVQKAQMYTQLAELAIQRKTAEKQNKLLDLDYTYYLNHPERNLGLQSMLGNLVSRVIGYNDSSVIPSPEQIKTGLNNIQVPKFNMPSFLQPKQDYNVLPPGNVQYFHVDSNKDEGLKNWKYDPDWYPGAPKNIQKQLNQAFNYVQTRNGKNDEKRIKGIDFLWENTNASEFFTNKSDFENKILNDSYYQKHLKKFIRFYIYPNGYFDNK